MSCAYCCSSVFVVPHTQTRAVSRESFVSERLGERFPRLFRLASTTPPSPPRFDLSWGVHSMFHSAEQVRAIALEKNELEALLFDMRSAPNKKHGELIDKYVAESFLVHISAAFRRRSCQESIHR